MPKKLTGSEAAAVNLRRMYVDCRHGQLHVHSAFASNGGFDELTTLVCLHDRTGTGRAFRSLLRQLGTDRSVYAPDLPGCGESDPPAGRAGTAAYAAAIGDFLDQLRLRQVDLLGHRDGAAVAAEVAAARPTQVRRVVLVSAPARLVAVAQPALVLRPRDDLWDVTPQATAALPQATRVDLPDLGADPFEAAPDVIAGHLRAFLD